MINKMYNDIKSIDKSIISIMFSGFKVSLIVALIASYTLYLYSTYPISHIAFESGILIFKTSLSILSACFVSALAINIIKNKA